MADEQVSEMINVPVATIRDWRVDHQPLPYSKIGTLVRYDMKLYMR
ncbi:hypothetical protein [Pseudoclavibacter sp. 8L]|nr:hypothetical protein [Pseudoclavibacter sp. 8L]